jgi:predicted transcriptional regulator
MPTPRSGMTSIILKQDPALDNREVADLLDVDIGTVKKARRYHGVIHKIKPRDRGYKQKILDARGKVEASELSKQLGCSRSYINNTWRLNP